MIKKKAQFTMKAKIEADSVIQLKDGRLLFYNFREDYNIFVYNEKTFEKLYKIDLKGIKYEFMIKYKGDKEKNSNKLKNNEEDKEKIEEDDFLLLFDSKYNESRNKNSIKELDNGLILIGRDKYLIELNLQKKNYDYKLAKLLDDDILEINQLSDKRIMIITAQKIILFERKNKEYIFKEEYYLDYNWKFSTTGFCREINQYFFSYELPNNKLLLNSVLNEFKTIRGCVSGEKTEFFNSKIIFIDLKNFKEILIIEDFVKDAKYIVLKNEIVIQSYGKLAIYDINSLKPIKVIENKKGLGYLYKFDKNHLIASSIRGEDKNFIIYKIENKDLIKHWVIREDKLFENLFRWNYYRMIGSSEFIFLLQDKRLMIRSFNVIYLFQIFNE